jgi:multidrug efflux pump subunit AcrA (membrane-fusion protein)
MMEGTSLIHRPVGRNRGRALALAAFVLLAAAAVFILSDPLGGSAKPSGEVSDNAAPTSLATVRRQSLSSQMQVNGTLGYGGASSIRLPAGTPPSAVAQAQQAVLAAEERLRRAKRTLSATRAAVAERRSLLATAQGRQAVSSAQQALASATMQLEGEREALSAAKRALASARAARSAARASAALYGQGSTYTSLPAVGRVLRRGQSLYEIDGQPVLLLYGASIPTRAFIAGMPAGADVGELNANLERLGFGHRLGGDAFTAATATAIRALQSAHGVKPTGELPLGSVVFEPGPVRVTSVQPVDGANVTPGPVLGVTSTVRQVTVALAAAQQSSVRKGDRVMIDLPNNQTTPGVVSSVGTVAKKPSGNGGEEPGAGGEESGPTIEVHIALSDPAAGGHLDEAPVTVSIATAGVPKTLAVPVTALLALAGGGYAVEVVEGTSHHLVGVSAGLFDDEEGLVQVSGAGLRAGQRIVVPSR